MGAPKAPKKGGKKEKVGQPLYKKPKKTKRSKHGPKQKHK